MQTYAFIWDLDGTLLDSYETISRSFCEVLEQLGITMDRAEVRRIATRSSLEVLHADAHEKTGVPLEELKRMYSARSDANKYNIGGYPESEPILKYLKESGHRNFVYTHRGKTTIPVLDNIGITGYFEDIVTSEAGLARKPAPDGVDYLVKKHSLSRENTYYVGDRNLDMQCAANAGVKSIMFIPPESAVEPEGTETHVISNLMEIRTLIDSNML